MTFRLPWPTRQQARNTTGARSVDRAPVPVLSPDGTLAARNRSGATFGPDDGPLAASGHTVVYWPYLTFPPLANTWCDPAFRRCAHPGPALAVRDEVCHGSRNGVASSVK
jgi:hypothetical protein